MNILFNKSESFNNLTIFCYGAGTVGQQFAQFAYLLGIVPDYFIDRNLCGANAVVKVKSNPWNPEKDCPIISLEEAQNMGKDNPIIVTMLYPGPVVFQLEQYGFSNVWKLPFELPHPKIDSDLHKKLVEQNIGNINIVKSKLKDKRSKEVFDLVLQYKSTGCSNQSLIDMAFDSDEYFPCGIIKLTKNAVFIDGGCYDNKTSVQFAAKTNNEYSRIYSFEPNPDMTSLCLSKMLPRQTIIQKALSRRNETLRFVKAEQGSRIDDEGEVSVDAVALDSIGLTVPAQLFIKLDVEGAETEALIGAANTIGEHRPLMAVCLYHKAEDLWEIPLYLMNKYPFYDFYVRHHSSVYFDTVLYCVPKEVV